MPDKLGLRELCALLFVLMVGVAAAARLCALADAKSELPKGTAAAGEEEAAAEPVKPFFDAVAATVAMGMGCSLTNGATSKYANNGRD